MPEVRSIHLQTGVIPIVIAPAIGNSAIAPSSHRANNQSLPNRLGDVGAHGGGRLYRLRPVIPRDSQQSVRIPATLQRGRPISRVTGSAAPTGRPAASTRN